MFTVTTHVIEERRTLTVPTALLILIHMQGNRRVVCAELFQKLLEQVGCSISYEEAHHIVDSICQNGAFAYARMDTIQRTAILEWDPSVTHGGRVYFSFSP